MDHKAQLEEALTAMQKRHRQSPFLLTVSLQSTASTTCTNSASSPQSQGISFIKAGTSLPSDNLCLKADAVPRVGVGSGNADNSQRTGSFDRVESSRVLFLLKNGT
jgi:hypothetical protein